MRKRERKSKEKRNKDESEERKKEHKKLKKIKARKKWITGSNVRNGGKPEETRKFRRQKQRRLERARDKG